MKILQKLTNAVGMALFTSLFAVFVLQVSARFGWNHPLPWTDELAVILYIWVILWAAAFMVPEREHVAFDLLVNLISPRARQRSTAFGSLCVGLLAAWALPATWDYVRFMAREGTPVLGLPFMAVFMPFVLLMLVLVWRGLKALKDLLA